MNLKNSIKLVGLDLDGTLTQHKSKLENKNRRVLEKICDKYRTIIVGAGSCERIYKQLNEFPINIIGNYGMQESSIVVENGVGVFKVIKDIRIEIDHEEVIEKINCLRENLGYLKYEGETVEFHESGAITFPLLGTEATLENKLSFDPDRRKRRKIYDIVKKEFADFNVFIGGTSSFDIVPKQFNKYIALTEHAKKHDIRRENIIYFGDDYGIGGNDEHIYESDIKFIKVDDYSMFEDYVREARILVD